eukprot:6455761-Amphidinium_carterae.2
MSCGKLERCLYGTRDAGRAFELFVYRVMKFHGGVWSPCLFHHKERQIIAFVYGDNFTTVASREQQAWFKEALAVHMWSKHEGTLGPSETDDKEVVCLNRIFRWNRSSSMDGESIDVEADARHVDILRDGIGLTKTSKSVVTPGITPKDGATGEALTPEDGVMFRSLVMRCNYLSSDRPEISYAAKEAARHMASPCMTGMEQTKRIIRYLHGAPRVVQRMHMQRSVDTFDTFSDANHGGCLRTRKSTSCAVVMHGEHMIKFVSATQQPIALSTAESEYYALTRAATIAVGCISMTKDFGIHKKIRLHGDATAASGIAHRRGAGKLRHIECATLWLQRLITLGKITLHHRRGEDNPADLGTKHLDAKTMQKHLEGIGYIPLDGKADKSLSAAL